MPPCDQANTGVYVFTFVIIVLLYSKIFAGLGTKQNLVIENGNGTYLGCGTPEDFTRLVVNNKWVVVEHFTNGTIDNIVKLYDTVQH